MNVVTLGQIKVGSVAELETGDVVQVLGNPHSAGDMLVQSYVLARERTIGDPFVLLAETHVKRVHPRGRL